MKPIERILKNFPDATRSGNGWLAHCPAHEDNRASLSIAEGENGRALVKCHAGCKTEEVCEAIGLTVLDLMPTADTLPMPSKSKGNRTIVATYDYRDEEGKLVSQVVRFDPKDFRQRKPKDGGGWDWSVKGVRRVPYRLKEMLADPQQQVFIVEGEKDADELAKMGLVATCNAGGAGKWLPELSEFLRNRDVVILSDNDDAGRSHAQQVGEWLQGIASSVRILELPGLPEKGDASDWFAAGGTKENLEQLAKESQVWTPLPSEPWPDITSFDVPDLPEFPTHVLPGAIRRWVEAESEATQTPPDLAGLLALAVCSAGIARRVQVVPRPGWVEPVNLFIAVLLEPGNRKSTVFSDAIKPFRDWEAVLIDNTRPTVERERSERRQDERRLQKLEKQAAEKGDAATRVEAGTLAVDLAQQSEPVLPRLIIDDATSEKLGMMLAEQGGRIASMSPEGGVFDLMAGLYSKSGIPQFGVYLMGHSGDDLTTDRVGRNSVRVERPALTCAYAMQPAVIQGLAKNVAFRGRGLLARFLYAAPQSWIGRRKIAPPPVSDAVREEYHKAVRTLAEAEDEFVLELTVDAKVLLVDWETEIESMLGEGGQMEIMCDWGAKLVGATLRLAAVLHCVEYGTTGQMDESTLSAAIEIARYLIPHAEAVLNMMQASEKPGDIDARYVLRWVERHGLQEFTRRDAHQHGKRRFKRADDVDAPLAELVRRGYIRLRAVETSGPGRPPSPAYEVNPVVFAEEKAEKCSHNSQNTAELPDAVVSENIESASEQSENEKRELVTI